MTIARYSFGRVFLLTLSLLAGLILLPSPAIADLILTNISNPDQTATVPTAQMNNADAIHAAAAQAGCQITGPAPGVYSFAGCQSTNTDAAPDPGTNEEGGSKTFALQMFDSAIGTPGVDRCLSC